MSSYPPSPSYPIPATSLWVYSFQFVYLRKERIGNEHVLTIRIIIIVCYSYPGENVKAPVSLLYNLEFTRVIKLYKYLVILLFGAICLTCIIFNENFKTLNVGANERKKSLIVSFSLQLRN